MNSNTSLTLVSNYTGPTQGGAAWYAVPRVAMNLVTAALVAQSAEALRGLNYDKQNWQRLFSASGNITVTLPDGSSFTGPSWQYMVNTVATKTNGAVPVNQGGTGSTTAEGGRTNLGLGSSATYDITTSNNDAVRGRVMKSGDYGLGGQGYTYQNNDSVGFLRLIKTYGSQFARNSGDAPLAFKHGAGIYSYCADAHSFISVDISSANVKVASTTDSALANGTYYMNTLYGTANTTKSSDGTIKAASPVARIVASQEACQRTDIAEDGFSWCGCGTANAEAEGITISRLDVGVYVLAGSSGLASEGWQLLPPMDPGGMGELGVVEAEQTESGGLTIRLFKRKYILSEEGEIVKTKGAPVDVPANSWIDVRLDMPEDSIWKTRASEASLELTEQPEDIQP